MLSNVLLKLFHVEVVQAIWSNMADYVGFVKLDLPWLGGVRTLVVERHDILVMFG